MITQGIESCSGCWPAKKLSARHITARPVPVADCGFTDSPEEALITLLVVPAGSRLSAGHAGQYLPPAPIHFAPIRSAQVHQAIAPHPSYLFQPQRSSAPACRASTPTQPGFLQACTWRQGTRQLPKEQEPPAPEPEPAPQGQRLPQLQISSTATCLQMRRSA